jgi:hypothetical protein
MSSMIIFKDCIYYQEERKKVFGRQRKPLKKNKLKININLKNHRGESDDQKSSNPSSSTLSIEKTKTLNQC